MEFKSKFALAGHCRFG